MVLPAELSLPKRAALVANADVVLSSCPVSQRLAAYCGTPLVALGAETTALPQRQEIRCLGRPQELEAHGHRQPVRGAQARHAAPGPRSLRRDWEGVRRPLGPLGLPVGQ